MLCPGRKVMGSMSAQFVVVDELGKFIPEI